MQPAEFALGCIGEFGSLQEKNIGRGNARRREPDRRCGKRVREECTGRSELLADDAQNIMRWKNLDGAAKIVIKQYRFDREPANQGRRYC